MQHQTPQFIDIEDKVIGPFTIRQFIYLAGGAGLTFILYRFLPFFFFLLLATPVVVLSVSLAFYRHNNRPFSKLLEHGFRYLYNSRLYLWRHRDPEQIQKERETVKVPAKNPITNPGSSLSVSKLKDLSWNLEVQDENKTM